MIHKFSMNGYNIVLDVDGGSVHILDDVAYELVDLYEENTKEEMQKEGYLLSIDVLMEEYGIL